MRNGLAEEEAAAGEEAPGEAPGAPAQLLPSPEVGSQRTLARLGVELGLGLGGCRGVE